MLCTKISVGSSNQTLLRILQCSRSLAGLKRVTHFPVRSKPLSIGPNFTEASDMMKQASDAHGKVTTLSTNGDGDDDYPTGRG